MLCDPKGTFKYKAGADCQSIWRKHGWVPPSEYRNDFLFKQNREDSNERQVSNDSPDKGI